MELTQAQYERTAHIFPKHRDNGPLADLSILSVILVVRKR